MNVGDLMINAQSSPFPNVDAVDRRIPSLDPFSMDSITLTDCSARRRVGHGYVLRTLLLVICDDRGHTNGQVGACRNVRAVDIPVGADNGPSSRGELGLN